MRSRKADVGGAELVVERETAKPEELTINSLRVCLCLRRTELSKIGGKEKVSSTIFKHRLEKCSNISQTLVHHSKAMCAGSGEALIEIVPSSHEQSSFRRKSFVSIELQRRLCLLVVAVTGNPSSASCV